MNFLTLSKVLRCISGLTYSAFTKQSQVQLARWDTALVKIEFSSWVHFDLHFLLRPCTYSMYRTFGNLRTTQETPQQVKTQSSNVERNIQMLSHFIVKREHVTLKNKTIIAFFLYRKSVYECNIMLRQQ